MTRRDGLLKLSAGLCLVLVPACVHTAGEAASDEPLVAMPWWAPPINAAAPVPGGARQEATGAAAPKDDRAVVQASAVQANPAGTEQSAVPAPEPELLKPPPSIIELKSRQQREAEQAALDPVPEAHSPVVVAAAPPAEDPPLVMAIRALINKRPAEAIQWLERCDSRKSSQDLLLTLLSLAARISDGDLTKMNSHEATAALAQLDNVTETLRPLADFTIEKMCFCYHIAGFGVYYAWPEDHVFRPREQVQVYVELRNFDPRQRKNLYGIELNSTLEIRKPDGGIACQVNPRDSRKPYLSLSPRHDFFVNYQFEVPEDLEPNRYTLWIRVTDRPTGRTASRSMEFRVQNSLARGE
jgi:hypothetical protein